MVVAMPSRSTIGLRRREVDARNHVAIQRRRFALLILTALHDILIEDPGRAWVCRIAEDRRTVSPSLRDVRDVVVGLAAAQREDLIPKVVGSLPQQGRIGPYVAAVPTPGVARRRPVSRARQRHDGVVVLA